MASASNSSNIDVVVINERGDEKTFVVTRDTTGSDLEDQIVASGFTNMDRMHIDLYIKSPFPDLSDTHIESWDKIYKWRRMPIHITSKITVTVRNLAGATKEILISKFTAIHLLKLACIYDEDTREYDSAFLDTTNSKVLVLIKQANMNNNSTKVVFNDNNKTLEEAGIQDGDALYAFVQQTGGKRSRRNRKSRRNRTSRGKKSRKHSY